MLVEITDKEYKVLQDFFKRIEGGSEKPAQKSKPKKLTPAERLKKKYGS